MADPKHGWRLLGEGPRLGARKVGTPPSYVVSIGREHQGGGVVHRLHVPQKKKNTVGKKIKNCIKPIPI